MSPGNSAQVRAKLYNQIKPIKHIFWEKVNYSNLKQSTFWLWTTFYIYLLVTRYRYDYVLRDTLNFSTFCRMTYLIQILWAVVMCCRIKFTLSCSRSNPYVYLHWLSRYLTLLISHLQADTKLILKCNRYQICIFI